MWTGSFRSSFANVSACASASAMTILALARERLAQDERELGLLKDEQDREWRARRIAFERATAHIAEARLH